SCPPPLCARGTPGPASSPPSPGALAPGWSGGPAGPGTGAAVEGFGRPKGARPPSPTRASAGGGRGSGPAAVGAPVRPGERAGIRWFPVDRPGLRTCGAMSNRSLLQMKWAENRSEGIWARSLTKHPSEWLKVVQEVVEIEDYPVPEAVWRLTSPPVSNP